MGGEPKDFFVLNGLTRHWPHEESLNEVNEGLGVERRYDESSIGAGFIKDSFNNTSPYVQASWYPEEAQFGPLSLGVTGSISHRQKAEGNPLDGVTFIPMATGEIMITDKSGVNLGIVPPVTEKGGLAFLQYKHQFGGGDEPEASPEGDELQRRMEEKRQAVLASLRGESEKEPPRGLLKPVTQPDGTFPDDSL